MTAPVLLTPNQIIIKSGTYIVIESIEGAILTCGSQTYTLGSGETVHAFEVTAGTYVCTANKTDYYDASASVTISTGFEYVTLTPTFLPTAYQQVEYLRGDGGQYIITPVTTADNQTIYCKFRKSATRDDRVFAASNGSATNTVLFVSTTRQYIVKNNSNEAGVSQSTPAFNANTVYDVTVNPNTTLTVNGTNYTGVVQYGGSTSAFYINLFNQQGFSSQNLSGDMFNFRVTQSGSKIIDCIPCYRKNDNVAGMYDKVSNTFLTNSGTGSFTVGADV